MNQVGKIVQNIIKNATNNINKIAKERNDQVIKTSGTEIERIAPKIIRGAIEEIYKTPFRLLGSLGKKQFQKIKRRLFKSIIFFKNTIIQKSCKFFLKNKYIY